MCEICEVQRDYPQVPSDAIERIIKAVEQREEEHLQHTILSIMQGLNVTELTITDEQAQNAAQDLDMNGVTVSENIASNWSSMTYKIERNDTRPVDPRTQALRPLEEGEVSSMNDIAAMFKALGLTF